MSDRLSILVLKILFGEQAGKDVAHFKKEKAVLLTKLRAQSSLNGGWFEGYSELAAVNAMLWHAEDDLRIFRGSADTVPYPVECLQRIRHFAFTIQALNDRRAALIAQINTLTGDAPGLEKL